MTVKVEQAWGACWQSVQTTFNHLLKYLQGRDLKVTTLKEEVHTFALNMLPNNLDS